MGSWRAVAVLALVAAAAWIAVGLGAGDNVATSESRRLVPGISGAETGVIELGRNGAVVTARRERGRFVAGEKTLDPGSVDTLLGAVEHTWVRRLRAGDGGSAELGLASPRATLALTAKEGSVRQLRLGVELGGRSLVWVGVDGDAALITATEAGQIFPRFDELLDRRPFRALEVTAVEITAGERSLSVSGSPRSIEVAGGRARVDAGELEIALEALRSLELDMNRERGNPGALFGGIRLSNDSGVEWLQITADCGDQMYAVTTHAGAGCVVRGPIKAALALATDPLQLVDDSLVDPRRRLASIALTRDGREVSIDPRGPGRDAALEWIAGIVAIEAGPARVAGRQDDAEVSLEVRYAAEPVDRIALRRERNGWIARRNAEPVELPVAGIEPLLEAEPVWFRARELIERDPSELVSARRGDATLDLGAVAPLVAHLSAVRFIAATAAREHGLAAPRAVIELTFARPPVDTGEPNAYKLEIGAAIKDGCAARLTPSDGAVFVLAPAVCDGLLP